MAEDAHPLARRFRFRPRGADGRREQNRVDFVFGLARNARLVEEVAVELLQAEAEESLTGKPARRFKDFRYATLDSWSRRRRVIGKAEWTQGEANPRFIVTSLSKAGTSGRFALRRIGLAHTQFAHATCGTIRLKLLKLAVSISARRISSPSPRPVPTPTNGAWPPARLA